MSSLTKIEANRQNAQYSTGPKTDEGKANSCLNHLKHGLRARTVVLPEENQEDFDAEYQDLLDHCQPEGPIEHHLVEHMVGYRWKSIRSGVVFRLHVGRAREDAKTPMCKPPVAVPTPDEVLKRLSWPEFRDDLENLEIMEQRYDRAYLRAERRLSQLQLERRQQPPQPEPLPTPEPEHKPAQESNPAPEPNSEPQPEAVQVGQAVPPASPQAPAQPRPKPLALPVPISPKPR